MSRTTNNYDRKNIDFISTIAEIAEPFNSTLLDKYPEYKKDISAYAKDEKECFLSILNKIGEDGCQILTDQVVNYIDDISNVDSTIPSALLSQANSIGYPYKDKKIVEQLSRLTKCSPFLQSIVWAVSTNITNSKTILKRLNILSEQTYNELSSCYSTDQLNTEISSDLSNIFINELFEKKYLYLDASDKVSDEDMPAMIDFSWLANTIFSNNIISDSNTIAFFDNMNINFGKYNRTIFSIVCANYLYSQIYNNSNFNNVQTIDNIEQLTKLSKICMPFLYDIKLFDPIQAAWSIIYDDATLSDYDHRYHNMISEFMKAFNEKLNTIAYEAILNKLDDSLKSKNINFALRLNSQSFSYQQMILQIIANANMLFGLDLANYSSSDSQFIDKLFDKSGKYWQYCVKFGKSGLAYLNPDDGFSLSQNIDWRAYSNDLVQNIFKFGKNLRTLREDLRLMTLRNSYKGTAALIQFSTIEYLKDCIEDLLYQAQEKYNIENNKHVEIPYETISSILSLVNRANQQNIGISEYWDYTEYFNRVDGTGEDDSTLADWEPNEFISYGSLNDDEIFNFYSNILNLPKSIYTNKNSSNDYIVTNFETKIANLKTFLRQVYNSGIFTERTNDDYEAIYSGNIYETTNNSPWVAYKNQEFVSKEIHPYIWNFTNKIVKKLYKSNAISIAIQNAEYKILNEHVGEIGNILDQYKLSENFVDSSGYVTRYEHRDHEKLEKTQSYDGIIYPEFAYDLATKWTNFDTLSANWDDNISGVKQKWYTDQAITLSMHDEEKELRNLSALLDNADFKKSVSFPGTIPASDTELSGVLGNYCIDRYETAYGVNPHSMHEVLYKENGYPFMRPLINFNIDSEGNKVNSGMLFVNADGSLDTEISDAIYDEISADKFPRIVISQDGTHLLLRTGKNKLRSYSVTTYRDIYNEIEPALKLNAIISCDDILFSDKYFNDSLIKSIDDAFYILIPQFKNNKYTNYIFYLKNEKNFARVTKQTFETANETDLFGSGMFLNNGTNINVNTYYINSTNLKASDANVISAIYSDVSASVGNHMTTIENCRDKNSSFDVMEQFVQMYSSELLNAQDASIEFCTIPFDNSSTKQPIINLSIESIETELSVELQNIETKVEIDNDGYLAKDLQTSTEFPFSRVFNLNSDAGFNPIYIGKDGKIILENRAQQFKNAKSTGAAFELLGPQIDFEANPIVKFIPPDEITYERIHEFYSFDNELSAIATSFSDVSSDISSYRHGYTSIMELDGRKDDWYRIKTIFAQDLIKLEDNESYVTLENEIDAGTFSIDSNFDYNRFYIFIGVNDRLYSFTPRKVTTLLQKDTGKTEFSKIFEALTENNKKYEIEFNNTYVINKIVFENKNIKVYGKAREILNSTFYLVHVVGQSEDSPNFMLPFNELNNVFNDDSISCNMIDEHMRAPHVSITQHYSDISTATFLNDSNINECSELSSGSIVFSILDIDSDLMNQTLPDEYIKSHSFKSVTTEAMNDWYRYNELRHGVRISDNKPITFDILDYDFRPWQIDDLVLERKISNSVDIGYKNIDDSLNKQYIIQPYFKEITVNQDSSNKYTITFWRRSEDNTYSDNNVELENVLPNGIKISEDLKPIYGTEHQSLVNVLNNEKIIPQLMMQWGYINGIDSGIRLRFNNASSADSGFINTNSGLDYKSLSVFEDEIEINPGESAYIDIVAPNHIMIGKTVFYNIPIMRAYITNISDNKPKFMLTLLNDLVDKHVAIESNNYALVFMSSSKPETSNSDIMYVTCYVAPILSNNQTNPPSVTNALSLSELAFNFDIGNVFNKIDNQLVDFKQIVAITDENKISTTAMSYSGFVNNMHQVRISEPMYNEQTTNTIGFKIVDMKIDLSRLSTSKLKSVLLSAHGDVIAYDKFGNQCSIVKIFGCSLEKIGEKHILGITPNNSNDQKILTVTQNINRETTMQVNPTT